MTPFAAFCCHRVYWEVLLFALLASCTCCHAAAVLCFDRLALCCVFLCCAVLCCFVLCRAVPCCACCAVLCHARLAVLFCAVLCYAVMLRLQFDCLHVTGRLLEMETAAWKDDRRFRLLTVDNGTFSFTDLMFNTPGKPATKGVAPPPPPVNPDNITITGTSCCTTVISRSWHVTLASYSWSCTESVKNMKQTGGKLYS